MNSNGMDMNAYRDNEEVEELEQSKNDDVEERIRRILRNGAQKKVGDKKSIIDPRPVGTSPDSDQTRTKFSNDSYRQEEIIRQAEAEQEFPNARFPQRASSSKTRKEHARDECQRRSTKARPLSQVPKSLSFREPTTSMSKLIPTAGEDFYNNRRASGGASYPSPSPSPNSGRVSYDRTNSKLSIPPSRQTSVRSNKSNHSNSSFKRAGGVAMPRDPLSCSFYRDCRSNSFAFSMENGSVPLRDLPPKEQRHRKVGYCVIIFSSLLLLLAVLCIIISLHFSASIGG